MACWSSAADIASSASAPGAVIVRNWASRSRSVSASLAQIGVAGLSRLS
ncbi:hypothetical protein [Streptacidiphilus neutrinimicus]|nr:hypothetical protein [Streptacidiphilus neutrinimicus]